MSSSATTPTHPSRPAPTRRHLLGGMAALAGALAASRAHAQNATPVAATPKASPGTILASPVAGTSEPLPYLFIQTSAQGSWTAVRGQPGAFWLTLSGISPQTIVIRDEPANAAGTISTALFFDSIYVNTAQPLQAVVSAQTTTGEDVLVVSLLRATYDPSIGELMYVASKLNDYTDQHGITPLQGQDGNFTLPSTFGATTLFITNAFCRSTAEGMCQFG